jgi:hypothetical protein
MSYIYITCNTSKTLNMNPTVGSSKQGICLLHCLQNKIVRPLICLIFTSKGPCFLLQQNIHSSRRTFNREARTSAANHYPASQYNKSLLNVLIILTHKVKNPKKRQYGDTKYVMHQDTTVLFWFKIGNEKNIGMFFF